MYCASKNSKNRIAHDMNCGHISKCSPEDLIYFDDRTDMLEQGYHLCKHCRVIDKKFKQYKSDYEEYAKRRSLLCELVDDKILVTSRYDEWAIIEDNKALKLFHKSQKPGGAYDFFITDYHDQHISYYSLKKILKYICAHDKHVRTQRTTLTIVENKPKNATIKKTEGYDWMKKKPNKAKPSSDTSPFLLRCYNHDYPIHQALSTTCGMSVKVDTKHISVRFNRVNWFIKENKCESSKKLIVYYVNYNNEKIYVTETETLKDALIEIADFYYEYINLKPSKTDMYMKQCVYDYIKQGIKRQEKLERKKARAAQKKEQEKSDYQRIEDLFALLESRKSVVAI